MIHAGLIVSFSVQVLVQGRLIDLRMQYLVIWINPLIVSFQGSFSICICFLISSYIVHCGEVIYPVICFLIAFARSTFRYSPVLGPPVKLWYRIVLFVQLTVSNSGGV